MDEDSNEVIATPDNGTDMEALSHAAWSEARDYGTTLEGAILQQLTDPVRPKARSRAQLERLIDRAIERRSGQERKGGRATVFLADDGLRAPDIGGRGPRLGRGG